MLEAWQPRGETSAGLKLPSAILPAAISILLISQLFGVGNEVWTIPEETDEILPNPGVGWQTFNRTSKEDGHLPAWIPSTVSYSRWSWKELEPAAGQVDFGFIDGILRKARESGQTLAFRVMSCSPYPGQPYHPDWLGTIGGKVVRCRYAEGTESGMVEIPDLDDPLILSSHLELIRRLGERYDGDPGIESVDIGSIGWWGEWHMSGATGCGMPSAETQRAVVEAYLSAFRKTRLLMLISAGYMLRHATSRGAGWRADCLGDMGGFFPHWNHMEDAYPAMLAKSGAREVWRTAPVAWETCWDMRKWVEAGWPLRTIFDYALALHGSCLNNKSAPLPEVESFEAELRRFLVRLGYRFVVREFRHPGTAEAGAKIKLVSRWQNTGSAPCYKPYRLAYRLSREGMAARVLLGGTTVDRWLPGHVLPLTRKSSQPPPELPPGRVMSASDLVTLPDDLASGEYVLSVGIIGPTSLEPAVRLAIKGRTGDGWYPLSRIIIL